MGARGGDPLGPRMESLWGLFLKQCLVSKTSIICSLKSQSAPTPLKLLLSQSAPTPLISQSAPTPYNQHQPLLFQSLGSVTGPPTLNADGGIELVYRGGASCELASGVPSLTKTTILFTCSKGGGIVSWRHVHLLLWLLRKSTGTLYEFIKCVSQGIPQLIDASPCSYSIVWETSAACRNSDYKPSHSCKVQDSDLGFNYDLTEMRLTDDYYSVSDGPLSL